MSNNKRASVILVSPLPPPVGGIATWTKNVLHYAKCSNSAIYHVNSAIIWRNISGSSQCTRFFCGIISSGILLGRFMLAIVRANSKVVHITSSASWALFRDVLFLIIARFLKKRVIFHFRFGRIPELARKRNWEWSLLAFLTKRSFKTIVLDRESFSILQKISDNCVLIPNPCSDSLKQIAANNRRYDVSSLKDVLFVGHVRRGKGIYELLNVFARVSVDETLEIIGPSTEDVHAKLRLICEELGISKRVRFSGSRPSEYVISRMQEASVLILPSYTEGFPNVVLEAMACGCPVIASSVGAIPDMLDCENFNAAGICCEKKSEESLEFAWKKFVSLKDARKYLSRNGKSKVLHDYTMPAIFERYQALWDAGAQEKG